MKRLAPLCLVSSLVMGVLTIAVVAPPAEVKAEPVPATYKLTTVETDAAPLGCVSGCPATKTQIPAYSPQSGAVSSLADATVIRTTTTWSGSGNEVSGGCAIVAQGGLKCWGDNTSGQLGTGSSSPTRIDTPTSAMSNGSVLTGVTDVSINGSTTCIVVAGDARCVGSGFEDPNSPGSWTSSTQWVTVQSGGISQVIVGNSTNYGGSSWTPACVLTTSGRVRCGEIRSADGWVDSGYSGVTDAVSITNYSGSLVLCLAGTQSLCISFASGAFKTHATTNDVTSSEAVYQLFSYSIVCFYAGGSTLCGSITNGEIRLIPVGVMPKPKSVFSTSMNSRLIFVLPTGLVYTEGWYFNCSGCVTSSIQVTPITAFSASTSSSYNFATEVLADTDTAEIIPLRVESGSRNTRTLAPIRIVTSSGTALSGTSIRWTAPDVPGTLGSSATSTLTSDQAGAARSTLATGPVTFTLSGGSAANGSSLHAASITMIVPSSGTVTVTVPDPPEIVNRRVTVLNADTTPVPNATVALRNPLLTYAYQSSGSSTSTWGVQAKDTRGFFNQVTCVQCPVTSPTYITGTDGSVTFRSYSPSGRPSAHDATAIYDDGDLNQSVNTIFTAAESTVSMPFMAKVVLTATDSDPSTPVTEIPIGADGAATVEVALNDENGDPVEGFSAVTETVCNEMETGGLTSATTRVSSICGSVVSSSSAGTSTGVSSQSVGKACASSTSAVTDKSGKAVFKFCATSSTKFRIRGKGALPSRTVCVVVKGKPCTVGSSSAGSSTTATTKAKVNTFKAKKGAKVALTKYLKPTKKSTATYKITKGKCKITGKAVVMPKKATTCTLRMTQKTKKRVKVKGKWTMKTTTTRKSVNIKVA